MNLSLIHSLTHSVIHSQCKWIGKRLLFLSQCRLLVRSRALFQIAHHRNRGWWIVKYTNRTNERYTKYRAHEWAAEPANKIRQKRLEQERDTERKKRYENKRNFRMRKLFQVYKHTKASLRREKKKRKEKNTAELLSKRSYTWAQQWNLAEADGKSAHTTPHYTPCSITHTVS